MKDAKGHGSNAKTDSVTAAEIKQHIFSGGGKIRASKVDVDTGGPGGRYRAWVETPVANKMFGDLTGYSASVGLPSFIAAHASDIAEFINKYGNGAPAIAHQSGVEKIPHN
jgi:hypothetical protein